MRKTALKLLTLALAAGFAAQTAQACGTFKVEAKDGTVMTGRTMEFGYETGGAISLIPRGTKFVSPAPENKTGIEWKSKYGIAGVAVFGTSDLIIDGMNEAGLAGGGFWYEANTNWDTLTPKEYKQALAHTMLITWALGNFSTVDELKEGIKKVKVFGYEQPQFKAIPPLHLNYTDANGNSVVVEYNDGKLEVYDNPYGILTNAPSFPWQVANLRNYIYMDNSVAAPINYMGQKIVTTGHGSRMFGLPGDLTPPSRFVRLAVTTRFATQPQNAAEALRLTEHILNSVDIVLGMAEDRNEKGELIASESTQWSTIRDLTNKVLYFRTYNNVGLRKIDLRKTDFTGTQAKLIPMNQDEAILDLTGTGK